MGQRAAATWAVAVAGWAPIGLVTRWLFGAEYLEELFAASRLVRAFISMAGLLMVLMVLLAVAGAPLWPVFWAQFAFALAGAGVAYRRQVRDIDEQLAGTLGG